MITLAVIGGGVLVLGAAALLFVSAAGRGAEAEWAAIEARWRRWSGLGGDVTDAVAAEVSREVLTRSDRSRTRRRLWTGSDLRKQKIWPVRLQEPRSGPVPPAWGDRA